MAFSDGFKILIIKLNDLIDWTMDSVFFYGKMDICIVRFITLITINDIQYYLYRFLISIPLSFNRHKAH